MRKIILLSSFLFYSIISYSQINYYTNSLDSILMKDTIHFWGTQVEYEYDQNFNLLGGQTVYQGISIFTKDSIFSFSLPYGYFGAKSYTIKKDTITFDDNRFEFKLEDTLMFFRDSKKRTIMSYVLMSLPSKYFIRMMESKIKLSNKEEEYIQQIIYQWIRDTPSLKWNYHKTTK